MSSYLREHSSGLTIAIRVQPKSSKVGPSGAYGQFGEQLKWGVSAPAEDGKANKELIASLSQFFGVPKSAVEIVQGESVKSKVVLLHDLDLEEAHFALDNAGLQR